MKVIEITPEQYVHLAELGVPVYASKETKCTVDDFIGGGDESKYTMDNVRMFASWMSNPPIHRPHWKYHTLVDAEDNEQE